MKSDQVHDFVHEKGGARHIARILKEGDTEKKDQYIRQKNDNAPHPGDDAVQPAAPAQDAVNQSRDKDFIAAIEAAYDEVARFEDVLSNWSDSSQITEINRAAAAVSREAIGNDG